MNDGQLIVLGTICFIFSFLFVFLHKALFYKEYKFNFDIDDGGLVCLYVMCGLIPSLIVISINWALLPTYLLLWAYYKHEHIFKMIKPKLRKFLENVLND